MIEFKCQHCGKGLHLNDSYAGRDGWCRVCKRMVIVPGGGPVTRVEDLPPEEGYERLQRLLQYAATKADKFKVHLAREAKEKEHAAQADVALEQSQLVLKAREAELERLNGEYVSLAAALREKEARLAELEASSTVVSTPEVEEELAVLRADLALERDARLSLSAALEERGASLAALEREVAELRPVAAEAHRLEENAAAERVNIRALEGAVATLKSQLAQAESERDRLAEILEEGSAGEKDSTLQLMQKDREIAALNAALAEMKVQQEESNRSTRDQIASLEGQVLLFNEIKERMAGLQGRIKDLEQERLDASLALDGAHQAEVLRQKKIGALEVSLKQALAEQSERSIQSDHFQRELAVRDEQVRKLTEELQALTEGRGSAILEAEKSTRTARSAESRAKRLAADLGDLQGARDQLAAENDRLKRSIAELEARVNSLNGSLEAARAEAAERASHEPAAAALQVELSAALLSLQRAEEDGAAEKASLNHTVAELQAEIMNLTEALQRETAQTELAHAQLASMPSAEAEATRLAELEAALARTAALETQLATRDELASRLQAESEAREHALIESRERIAVLEAAQAELEAALARATALEAQLAARDELASRLQAESEAREHALIESRERIAALEAALATAAAEGGRADETRADNDEEEDVSFILLSPEATGNSGAGATVVPPSTMDERQRQLEKKQMMEVLSDFLNK